jgi:hypothetical protein
MRLQRTGLEVGEIKKVLTFLLGLIPRDLPAAASPLYSLGSKEELVKQMPVFNEHWLVGPETSILVGSSPEVDGVEGSNNNGSKESVGDSIEDSEATADDRLFIQASPCGCRVASHRTSGGEDNATMAPQATTPRPTGAGGETASSPAASLVAGAEVQAGGERVAAETAAPPRGSPQASKKRKEQPVGPEGHANRSREGSTVIPAGGEDALPTPRKGTAWATGD